MGKLKDLTPVRKVLHTIFLIEPDGYKNKAFIWANNIEKAGEKSILADGVRIEFPYPIKFFS